jgi:hypothetical protein
VDTARLFPPTLPARDQPGSVLFNQFRPEFIKDYKMPLSSDAFTGFGRHNYHEHNKEIEVATRYLLTTKVEELTTHLLKTYASAAIRSRARLNVTPDFHGRGVNMRFIGYVRARVLALAPSLPVANQAGAASTTSPNGTPIAPTSTSASATNVHPTMTRVSSLGARSAATVASATASPSSNGVATQESAYFLANLLLMEACAREMKGELRSRLREVKCIAFHIFFLQQLRLTPFLVVLWMMQ